MGRARPQKGREGADGGHVLRRAVVGLVPPLPSVTGRQRLLTTQLDYCGLRLASRRLHPLRQVGV